MKSSKRLFMTVFVAALLVVSACSGSGGGGGSTEAPGAANTPSPASSPAGSGGSGGTDTASPEPEEDLDPLGKYDPPIKMTMAMGRSALSFVDGETDGDNRWIWEYEKALGIDVDMLFAAPSDQYYERLGVTVASGDLPDVFSVDKVTLTQLVEADLIEDMTEVYEKYATDLLKSIIDLDGNGYAWKQATFDGRLMALPERSASFSGKMIHIRKDWLDNLGLQPPKTMDDLLEISRAFTYDDPDGNGVDDTFGLGISNDLAGWNLDVSGFINGYGGMLRGWVKGDDGKLVYSSTLPAVRNALHKLQELYLDGQIDPEFGVKNIAAVTEDGVAGKYGIAFGSQSTPISPFQQVKKLNPDFDVISVPLVSATDEPAKAEGALNVNVFYVVRKGYPHPEAVVKMQNLYADIWFGSQSHRYSEMITGDVNGSQHNFFQYAPIKATHQGKNIHIHKRIVDVLNGRLPVSELNTEERTYYDLMTAYDEGRGDESGWAYKRVFGEESSLAVHVYYLENDLYQNSEFYGLPTETMQTRWQTLMDMENETFLKIIMGEPIESFDKFVNDWYNLGGRDITNEVNAWYEANR